MSSTINADNQDLQATCVGPLVVGFVDKVNGPAAGEVPGYMPTKAELLELVKYWESTFLNTEYYVFATGQYGGTEMRLSPYAERRVDRILELLGDDAIKAVCEIRFGFAKGVGPRLWKQFCGYLGAEGPDWFPDSDPYPHPELTRLKLILLAVRMMALAFLPSEPWRDGCTRPWDIYEYLPWPQRVMAAHGTAGFKRVPPTKSTRRSAVP